MDALLHLTRQLSKLDPDRLIANIHHIARGDAHAHSAWKALVYDLQDLDAVFHNLAHAGHDIRGAYRDFTDLRRWVYAAASSTPPHTPHPSRSAHLVRTPHASQRSPVTTSTRLEHAHPRPRVSSTIPTSPQQRHHSPRNHRNHVAVPTPVRTFSPPKARPHVRFASTEIVYRYAHATPPSDCVPRTPHQSHAR